MDATSRGSRSGAPEPTGKATVGLKPSISLVLPAYNEEAVIQQAIQEADDALAGLTDDYEVIVVDDGSSDRTKELAELEARTRPAVRVIAYGTNRGYGAALRTGFAAATKQWIGFTDADCQFDVTELDRLTLLLRGTTLPAGTASIARIPGCAASIRVSTTRSSALRWERECAIVIVL